jgi:hypothetical protein
MPAPQQSVLPWQVVLPVQQFNVLPQPSEWPHPPSKSAQVLGTHGVHALALHVSSPAHGAQVFVIPQPTSIGVQPVTMPASASSAHVFGVQHAPETHVSPVGQGEHDCEMPQPRSTGVQVAAALSGAPASSSCPHVLGVQHESL